jgi:Fur family transcriptional regulator, stress-responsive regulator
MPEPHASDVAALKQAELRVTAPRLAVMAVVREGDHMTVDEIVDAATTRIGSISKQGVYDVVSALSRAGLLRRIEPAGSPARFESRVGDNHHHVVCRSCGAVADIDCVVGAAPCVDPQAAAAAGFFVDEADVTFWGLCSECQAGAAGNPTTRREPFA